MNLSSEIAQPTLDKVHLKTFFYDLSPKNKFTKIQNISSEGEIFSVKHVCNTPFMNLTVQKDKQGKDSAFIYFNPNKITAEKVFTQCNESGLDYDLDTAQLIRLDIERHQQLKHKIDAYHSVLSVAGSGHKNVIKHNGTFTTGTDGIQWQIYDKSAQTKFKTPNICRGETRYLKPKYLKRSGINAYKDLKNADLMDLYRLPYQLYLSKLPQCKSVQHEKISSDIQYLEKLFKTDSRPVQTFLACNGINALGLEYCLEVIKCSNIPKEKKYNAKKYLFKLSERINIGFQSNMVEELLTYFQAVA
jgi:hypothetical protein